MIKKISERINGKCWCVFLGIIFCIMVLFELNISHMEQYKMIIANNIGDLGDLTWGNSKGIRSDEWLGVGGVLYNLYAPNHGLEGVMEHIVYYINPGKWGFAFLSEARGFSWYTLFPYFYGLVFSYLFMGILFPGKKGLSLASSLLISFAPESIWWWGAGRFADVFAIIVCFYYFFHTRKCNVKFLCAMVLSIFLPYFIIDVYPAWDVPLVYLAILITVILFIERRNELRWHKLDTIFIVAVITWTAIVLACYFITEKEALEAIVNTVYPGNRVILGGALSIDYFYHYMMMLKTPFNNVVELNNSEVSSYIALYPLPFLSFLFYYTDFMKNKLIVGLQILSGLLLVYAYIGYPKWIAIGTLMGYSIEERAFTIFGLVSTILLVLQLNMIVTEKLYKGNGRICKYKLIVFNITIVIYFMIGYIINVTAVEFLGVFTFVLMALLVLVLGNIMIIGKGKWFLAILLLLTFLGCYSIIPINQGIGIMTDTVIAQEIQGIEEEESGIWLTLDDWILAKYVTAQGVECINYLNNPPQIDLFELVDTESVYTNTYNRYAHIIVTLTESESYFELLGEDIFKIYLNELDLALWDVTYIVSKTSLDIDNTEYYTELKYQDTLDGILIYKIYYK